MHKTWPNPKFPDCVCDLGQCSGASISLAPCTAVLWWVSMGIRGGAGRTGEPGEGFCVWRVRHRFSEGVCKVRSSKVWVFPFPCGSRAESLGAGLWALLGRWSRWRPARAGGSDGKGWVASRCGDSCASLLGAQPRCWVGIRCAHNPCGVLAACGWGVSVQGVWDSWDVVITEQTRVLIKNNLGMSTLPCLGLMRVIGAFPPALCAGRCKGLASADGSHCQRGGEGAKMWLRVSPAGIESINLSGLFFPLFLMLLMGMKVGASFLFIFLTVFRC